MKMRTKPFSHQNVAQQH